MVRVGEEGCEGVVDTSFPILFAQFYEFGIVGKCLNETNDEGAIDIENQHLVL